MTPDNLFLVASLVALGGWLALAAGVALHNAWLRDHVAGAAVPLWLSAGYAVLLVAGLPGAQGGFTSLGAVAALFASPWVLLAGWVHYLAFDLFVGAWIAAESDRRGLPRRVLLPVLPLTALFGPIGLLAFACAARWARPGAAGSR